MNGFNGKLVSLAAVCWFAVVAVAQTAIQMRPSMVVAPGAAVTVADVAAVSGDDAAKLGAAVVVPADKVSERQVIDRPTLKGVLEKAGVSWAKATLSGATTVVTRGKAETPPPVTTNSTAATELMSTPTSDDALRHLIARQLAFSFDLRREDLRVRFDALAAADAQWLAQAVNPLWQYEVRAVGSSPTGKTPVRIEAYDRDALVLQKTITIEALMRREMPIATASVVRDQILTAGDVTMEERWVPLSSGKSTSVEELIGAAMKRRIEAGKPIAASDVAPPVVVKRGDEVWVHCISGGMVIKTKARALGSARNGEMVNLQVDGSKKTFAARMNGRGKAVMSLAGVADDETSGLLSGVKP